MKAFELELALKKEKPAALYAVVGEEDLLRDQTVALIRAASLGSPSSDQDGMDAFNYDMLYADESDAADILVRAGQAPVFTERRCVIVKSAEKLPARDGEVLLSYLKEPCETTTLVFVAAKLDGRLKFTQALTKSAVTIDCSSLPDMQRTAWLKREADALGLRLNEEAILLLKDIAGESLSLARRELEKLAIFVPSGAIAGPAEVEAVRGGEVGASVFDLTEAITQRDSGRALRILARNIEAGEDPLRILGSLAWQYRRLWKGKELLQQGRRESELSRLGIPPFKLREFVAQLRRFSERHFRTAFSLFMEADSKLKGGGAGARVRVLESVLLTLCRFENSADARTGMQPSATGQQPPKSKEEVSPWRTVR